MIIRSWFAFVAVSFGVAACGGAASQTFEDSGADVPAGPDVVTRPDVSPMPRPDVPPMPRGLPVLGSDRHTADSVRIREVANADDGLRVPRDLAFNPGAPEQLWITNYGSNSITIVRHVGTDRRDADTRSTRGSDHFLVRPSALAFGQPGFMATAQEMDRVTQRTTPANFMGPTLWPSDYDAFDGGHPSHLDMLHNSPNGNGIAWETGNVYWVVDGAHGSLTRYDFANPHEPGGEDHSDGIVRRYAHGMFTFMAGVSAHIEFDQMTRRLFLTEPSRNRVLTFDPEGATIGARITPNYDGTRQNMMVGGRLEVFIDGASVGLERPSGLALVNNIFYITDNANSKIMAFNREGMRLDWIDLSSRIPPGSMQGIALDQRGFIYLADAMGNRIFEIAPLNAQ